jgi:hypothetical protein
MYVDAVTTAAVAILRQKILGGRVQDVIEIVRPWA